MLATLNKSWIEETGYAIDAKVSLSKLLALPEKIVQFGTGVLLRGLPDYYVDKANKRGIFNGRIVVVKTTGPNTEEFAKQDNLYTIVVRGVENETIVEDYLLNTSISRVLSSHTHWKDVLALAANPEIEIIISNTTELGIVLDEKDFVAQAIPQSYPGKLLAYLKARFDAFDGAKDKGLIILPTELISNNGGLLKKIVLELAEKKGHSKDFIQWIETANQFCITLVDRIVPGKLTAADLTKVEEHLGYKDELMIMAEPFSLWAIEGTDLKILEEKLSFVKVDKGCVLTDDIAKFKELKLRLLNATHTVLCGISILKNFPLVKETMNDKALRSLTQKLMYNEIITAIVGGNVTEAAAKDFASKVIDRFANPFLSHKWESIAFNYTMKLNERVFPMLGKYHSKVHAYPKILVLGIAAYFVLYKKIVEKEGAFVFENKTELYTINDENIAVFKSIAASAKDATQLVEDFSKEPKLNSGTKFSQELKDEIATKIELIENGRLTNLVGTLVK